MSPIKKSSKEKECKRNNTTWYKRFEQLKAFQKNHGHCLVPLDYAECPKLGRWVKEQRYQYSKFKQSGKANHLRADKIKLLKDIGFVWGSHDVLWQKSFQELRMFKAEYGHCDVPTKFPPNEKLANWVCRQRIQHKRFSLGKQSSMTPERFASLEAIGFKWKVRHLVKKDPDLREYISIEIKHPIQMQEGAKPTSVSSSNAKVEFDYFTKILDDLSDETDHFPTIPAAEAEPFPSASVLIDILNELEGGEEWISDVSPMFEKMDNHEFSL